MAFLSLLGCQTKPVEVSAPVATAQVTVERAKEEIDARGAQFIDVRTPEEFSAEHALKAQNIPLDTIETELVKLDRTKPVYVICQTGRRSQIAAETLERNGFAEIYNVQGGSSAWKKAGLPIESK